jgi:hypothetical protein
MILKLLEKLNRKVIIPDRASSEPYLTRYYLLFRNRPSWFPFNVFLHNFHKGDPDDLHDHPWPYFTLILRGGYWEYTPAGRFWRGPGHFRFCSARSLHRIELEPGVDTWTLFVPGLRERDWGFIDQGVWKHHEQYLEERYNPEQTA